MTHAVDAVVVVCFSIVYPSRDDLEGVLFQPFYSYIMTCTVLRGNGRIECLMHDSIRGLWKSDATEILSLWLSRGET